jgi:hypothetical protein
LNNAFVVNSVNKKWIPAFAGMTEKEPVLLCHPAALLCHPALDAGIVRL